MELPEGQMPRTSSRETISTKQGKRATLARHTPKQVLTTLAHLIDVGWLREAYRRTRKRGAAGVDGVTAAQYETALEANLTSVLARFKSGRYQAPAVRRVHIPKAGAGNQTRPVGIPTLEDKVLQRAVVMALEPIYEQDCLPCSYGFRPGRSAHHALEAAWRGLMDIGGGWVVDLDIQHFFDNVRHHLLLEKVARRVNDRDVLGLLKRMLKATGKKGVPQGGVISPLLSNLYLTEVDRMLERAKDATRQGKYTYLAYVRFADDLVILVDAYRRHDWLLQAVDRRLREELARLQVTINEEKSRTIDLARGGSFGFLGFEFRRVRSHRGVWRANYVPKMKARTALLRKLKVIFRRFRSQPIERVVCLINPILRGWVHYFAVGHSSRCFSFVKDWVDKKVRRHLMRARKRRGFGWKQWSRRWLYAELGLFNNYRVRRVSPVPTASPTR